ncbi:MAG TPA: GerMN domain-containing protein [Thermoanaerobaculia bacterium]|nr:GerMN domain-containing protein [Thermoanaerobaculia bacterium]
MSIGRLRQVTTARTAILAILLVSLTFCRKRETLTTSLEAGNKVAPRTVRLFYESADLLLFPEMRNLQLPENPAGALPIVVRELLKGPASAGVPRLFPADTVVRGAFLLPDGTALVDLGGETVTRGWSTGSHHELMAVYSVVFTVTTNFPTARRVRLLLNGEPAETLGGHVSLDKPLVPMAALTAGAR